MTPEDTMIRLVRKVRDQLEFYGDQHLAKNPPQPEKAKANYDLVHEINDALLGLATPPVMTLTPEMEEAVRDPDTLRPGPIVRHEPGAMHIGGIEELRSFLETLQLRDGEDYTAVRMRIADLRTLVGVDAG